MNFRTCTLLQASFTVALTLNAAHAHAEIEVTPGPSDPAYPAAMPDPWVLLGDLDLNGSSLTVDDGSALDIAGSLWLDDTPVGGTAAPVFTFNNATLDITGRFLAQTTGPDADFTLTAIQTTADIGQDFILSTAGTNPSALFTESALTAGNDIRFESTADETSFVTLLFDTTAGNDLILNGFGGDDSAYFYSSASTAFSADRDLSLRFVAPGPTPTDVSVDTNITSSTYTTGRNLDILLPGTVDENSQSTHAWSGSTFTAGESISIHAGPVLDIDEFSFNASNLTFNAPTTTLSVPSIEYTGSLDVAGDIAFTNSADNPGLDLDFDQAVFDVDGNFLAEAAGPASADSGLGVSITNTTGTITGDLILRDAVSGAGGGFGNLITDTSLNVGGDLRLEGIDDAPDGGGISFFHSAFTATVDNDFVLDAIQATDGETSLIWNEVDIDAGNDVLVRFNEPGSDLTDTSNIVTITDTTLDAERDIVFRLGGSGPGATTVWSSNELNFTAGRSILIEAAPATDPDNFQFDLFGSHTFNAPNTTIAVPEFDYDGTNGDFNVVGDIAFTNSTDNSDLTFAFSDGLFDIDGNFAIQTPGMDATLSVVGADTTIDVEGDITVAGGGDGSSSVVSMNDTTLTSTTGDVRLNLLESGAENADGGTIITSSSIAAANDIVIAHDGGANSSIAHSGTNTTFSAGNDIVFDYANEAGTSNSESFVSLGFATFDADRDIVVDWTGSDADRESQFSWVSNTLTAGRSITLSAEAVNDASNYTTALFDIDFNAPMVNLDMPITIYDEIDVDGDLIVSQSNGGVIPVLTSRYVTDGGFAFDRLTVTGSANIQGGGLALFPVDATPLAPGLYDSALIIAADGGATGAFDTIEAPDYGDGSTLAITYEATGVRATRALFGDANLDMRVDEADFLLLAESFGGDGTWVQGNFDQANAAVDGDDLSALIANFADAGTTDADTTPGTLVLQYNPNDGSLTLVGDGSLNLLSLLLDTGTLDGDDTTLEGFDTLLTDGDNRVAFGSAGGSVLLDGQLTLGTTYSGDPAGLRVLYGLAGDTTLYQATISEVPEPSTFAILLAGGLALSRRRRF